MRNPDRIRRALRSPSLLTLAVAAAIGCSVVGCARSYYRRSADREVHRLIDEKAADPRWALTLPTIQPPEDSRLFEPNDLDHPPLPPDDPASGELMEHVDGMRGVGKRRKPSEPGAARSDSWLRALPRDGAGQVVLNLESTIGIGLKNARTFQQEREDLYLSALDVTFERFRFDAQYSLGGAAGYSATGSIRSGKGKPVEDVTAITDGSVRWLSATGGELLAGLANTLVWEYNGSTVDTATSLLNFSLVQPLLRFGGRTIILERLTQAERSLLANVRQMEQFRKGFYIRLAAGRNAGEGPSRGGAVGASGLGLIAGTPSGTVGAPRADGLIGLLEEQRRIGNLEGNVARLRESLDQLEAAFDAGRISSRLQVDQARQALYSSQSSLLSSFAAYQTRLDSYKVDLGLPPELPAVVRDPLLDRLALTDANTTNTSLKISAALEKIRDRDSNKTKEDLVKRLEEVLELEEPFRRQLDSVESDLVRMRENLPVRQRQLQRLRQRPDLDSLSIEVSRIDARKLGSKLRLLEDRHETMTREVAESFESLRTFAKEIEALEVEPARSRLVELASRISGQMLALSLDQTAVRLETLALPPIDIRADEALAIARENRLDWMNARARLVDAWRQIDVNANPLLPGLTLTANGQMGSIRDNLARLDGRNGVLRFGLRFDSPLSLLAERNNYREALIDYQRARRNLDEFEDRVNLSLRNTLRIVDLSQLNFELRREAVQIAISQVDLARLRLDEPPKPGAQAQFGATTARDLVSALSDLLNAQNDFLGVWVSYEVLRMLLDFEMGTMQLSADGRWRDPGPLTGQTIRKRLAAWTIVEKGKPKAATASRLNN
jgi:outer membrane protein TolC